jgi:hypothetical protein
MFNLPRKIKVVDVSARDGLQSFPRWVDTDIKTLAAARDIARMLDIQSNAFVAAGGTRKSIMDEARSHQRFHPA